jgi:hypothetical protein
MTKHIVTHIPKKYMTQPFYRYCGIFQIATIYESRTNKSIDPNKIFGGFIWLTGFCTPKQIVRKFNQLGLPSSIMNRREMTLANIKESVKNNHNVILLSWHGYTKTGDTFNPLKAFFSQHYISIRWYDDSRKWFFVYDSSIKQGKAHLHLPVGNMFIPERIIKRAFARAWWWLMSEVAIVV